MKTFIDWVENKQEKNGKILAMRRWLWNQEHGSEEQKKAKPPVQRGDPDFEEIEKKAAHLGGLDPNTPLS